MAHLLVDGCRDADAAWLREPVQPRRDVDAVSVDLLSLNHHVPEVDADAEVHPAVGGERIVPGADDALDLEGAARRVEGARELGQQVVARGVHDAPAMLPHQHGELLAVGGEGVKGLLLVRRHEPAGADHVGGEDCGESALDSGSHQTAPSC